MAQNSQPQPVSVDYTEIPPPATQVTEQAGSSSQTEPPATDLTMRAIQAAEELAKALKQFHPPTLGKGTFLFFPPHLQISLPNSPLKPGAPEYAAYSPLHSVNECDGRQAFRIGKPSRHLLYPL